MQRAAEQIALNSLPEGTQPPDGYLPDEVFGRALLKAQEGDRRFKKSRVLGCGTVNQALSMINKASSQTSVSAGIDPALREEIDGLRARELQRDEEARQLRAQLQEDMQRQLQQQLQQQQEEQQRQIELQLEQQREEARRNQAAVERQLAETLQRMARFEQMMQLHVVPPTTVRATQSAIDVHSDPSTQSATDVHSAPAPATQLSIDQSLPETTLSTAVERSPSSPPPQPPSTS